MHDLNKKIITSSRLRFIFYLWTGLALCYFGLLLDLIGAVLHLLVLGYLYLADYHVFKLKVPIVSLQNETCR